jgi:hypothetical protein
MTQLHRSKCPKPEVTLSKKQGPVESMSIYQHYAVNLKSKIDCIQEHDDRRNHDLAHSDDHLPKIKIDVIAMREKVEGAVRS